MADEGYGDDDAYFFDDDDYLYVEDDYAIAVSLYLYPSTQSVPLLQPRQLRPETGFQRSGSCMSHTSVLSDRHMGRIST